MLNRSLLTLLLAACAAFTSSASGAGPAYEENRHYERIVPAQPTQGTGGKVEVVEVFWYGCPHCYEFEPVIEQWLAARAADATSEFRRVPGVFRELWAIHARTYYAAQELGVLDKMHKAFFDALHKNGRKLFDFDSIAAFMGEHGVAADQFKNAYESIGVDTKVRQAAALSRGYGISGVPAMVVNGKYRISAQGAGGYEEMLKVAAFLVDKERAEQASQR
jgi:thiol:disulfide interchange protein DsbA